MNDTPRRGRPRRFPAPVQVEGEVPEVDAPEASQVSNRPPMRAQMREDDPWSAAAAKRRYEEVMGHIGTVDDGVDEFAIDRRRIPDGWDAEWKTKTVLGAEDPAQMVAYQRMGWEPAPTSLFPELMPADWKGNTVERKGMILMLRPKQITDQVRAVDARRAREQIRHKEAQLASAPDGQFTRDHNQVKPKIGKSYEPMPIPQD